MRALPDHRANSFDFVRFVAAGAVLISHHSPTSGGPEPAIPIMRDTLGGAAVCVFFAMSGFLILQSLERSNRWDRFFAARILRLLPNLLFALVFTSLLMMAWFDNAEHLAEHLDYIVNNAMMMIYGVQYTIVGVLEDRPISGPNGSLWTLPYEFWMYVGLFMIFLLRPRLRIWGVLAAAVFFQVLWLNAEPERFVPFLKLHFRQDALGKLGLYFFSGSIVALLWPAIASRRALWVGVATLGAVVSRLFLPTESILFTVSLSILIILFCSTRWLSGFSRFGDPSYGMYVSAFPIQQLALLAFDEFYVSMLVALLLSTTFGYSTWHLFERRCLSYRDEFIQVLRWPFEGRSRFGG